MAGRHTAQKLRASSRGDGSQILHRVAAASAGGSTRAQLHGTQPRQNWEVRILLAHHIGDQFGCWHSFVSFGPVHTIYILWKCCFHHDWKLSMPSRRWQQMLHEGKKFELAFLGASLTATDFCALMLPLNAALHQKFPGRPVLCTQC